MLSPIPGSTREKNDAGYPADSGLDIAVPVGTACVAVADGVLVYSEPGHTPWVEDTNLAKPGFQYPHSILLKLDKPVELYGKTIRFAWYTHLTSVVHQVPDGGNRRVKAGEVIAHSGIGNRVPHLHFGLLTARTQREGEFLSDRQVADVIWPRVPLPAPKVQAKHAAQHRTKLFQNERGSRAFQDGSETAALDVHVQRQPDGKLLAWVNGHAVVAHALTLDLAHD